MREKLSQIGVAFERLSGREQLMVLFMVLAVGGMIFGWASYFVRSDLSLAEERITEKTKMLSQLVALKNDYQRRLSDQNRLASEIKKNNSVRLLSYIEDVSKKANIELGNAAERGGEPTGSDKIKEEAAEVTIRNVSMDRLYKFLDELERGQRLVKVRRLKVKTRFDNAEMLDATVTVGTFKSTGK